MSTIIFCSNCGSELFYNNNHCDCGYTMTIIEKNQINSSIQKIASYLLVDSNLKESVKYNYARLSEFRLDGLYFKANSAKNDYKKKVNFIQKELVPNINNWKDEVERAEKTIIKDKIEIYGRIMCITEFILKDFFGPFSIKEKGMELFVEYSDFSKFKLSETMFEGNLDFTDIQSTDFGVIGSNVINSVDSAIRNGSFTKLAKKSNWSKSDINTVKAELGVAIATEIISGIANMLAQNSEAIQNVRQADKALNCKISEISKIINSLEIEENELNKQKKFLDTSETILDHCVNKTLKPVIEELQKNKVFIEYKEKRIPYDLQQDKINLDELILSEKVAVSFWGCLFGNEKENYKNYWSKRATKLDVKKPYLEINLKLKEYNHQTFLDSNYYKESKTEKFREFEKINRRILKTLPEIVNNKNDVLKFADVLKVVKSHLKK